MGEKDGVTGAEELNERWEDMRDRRLPLDHALGDAVPLVNIWTWAVRDRCIVGR